MPGLGLSSLRCFHAFPMALSFRRYVSVSLAGSGCPRFFWGSRGDIGFPSWRGRLTHPPVHPLSRPSTQRATHPTYTTRPLTAAGLCFPGRSEPGRWLRYRFHQCHSTLPVVKEQLSTARHLPAMPSPRVSCSQAITELTASCVAALEQQRNVKEQLRRIPRYDQSLRAHRRADRQNMITFGVMVLAIWIRLFVGAQSVVSLPADRRH